MTIKIEKNVPMPKPEPKTIYPFADMEPGDSFLVKREKKDSVRTMATRRGKVMGRRFTVRKVEGGYRCWRVE